MTQPVVRGGANGSVVDGPVETLSNAEKYPHLSKYADPVQQPAREIIGREKELQQMMASLNRPELSNILLIAPPGSGKLLPLDTPIPTPDGWTTMGELEPGDMVLGQDGKPTKVSYVSEVEDTPELYELYFSDGSTQIACADHQWRVDDYSGESGDPVTRVMTTQEMVDTGVWPDDADEPVFDIAFSDPLVLPEKDFEIGPEVYGFALGVMDHLSECRIRPDYLRGSFEQRLALLRGLMYANGDVFGPLCVYTLTIKHKDLSDDVYELLRTLGIFPEYDEGFEENTGREFFFDTALTLLDDIDPEWTPDGTQGSPALQITNIQPVTTQPGRCIQVDNEDHMYLCGKSFIPTHNTALVQAAKMHDLDRTYIELDLSRMIANLNNENEMAARLKALFDEAERYAKQEGRELVIFMDEFHQVVQLSAAAVEALKPVLAASGTRGILVIAATTFEEYHEYIAPNQPLDERLQRINLDPADKDMTIRILRGMAQRYDVADQFYDDRLFELMYEWTNRYIPRSTQPRKSIRLLDAMIGWHRYTGEMMTEKLLAKMLQQQTGMDLAFTVDGDKIKENLDAKVFSQDAATSVISRRLQLAVADLNDKSRPMFSALFTGATGVGKTEMSKQLTQLLFGDQTGRLIRFDMTEFALESSLPTFKTELTQKVADMGHAVILFDEIEKANPVITRLLLQILDDGRMRDDHGRQVSFLNCYIIITTNAGSEVYKTIARYNADDRGSAEAIREYEKVIRASIMSVSSGFPPELLGRLDAIVPFQPLSRNTQRKIVKKKMLDLRNQVYDRHGVKVRFDSRVLDYITEDKVDVETDAGGARAAVRLLNDEVATEIAMFLNRHKHVKTLQVSVQGTMRNEDKTMLKSKAKIVVREALGVDE